MTTLTLVVIVLAVTVCSVDFHEEVSLFAGVVKVLKSEFAPTFMKELSLFFSSDHPAEGSVSSVDFHETVRFWALVVNILCSL